VSYLLGLALAAFILGVASVPISQFWRWALTSDKPLSPFWTVVWLIAGGVVVLSAACAAGFIR
jgi:hypothetical protein